VVFRHQAVSGAAGEISGHHHPKAAVPARGTSVTRPCFVTDARRVVMPAFGAYTGGMDVREPGIAQLFPRGGRVFLLGRERLYSFAIGPSAASGRASRP
jgi:metallophosphoesterase superfamily enzyme